MISTYLIYLFTLKNYNKVTQLYSEKTLKNKLQFHFSH